MITDRIAAVLMFVTTLAGVGSTAWQYAGKAKAEKERDAVRLEFAAYKLKTTEDYAKALESAKRKQQVLSQRQQAALSQAHDQLQTLVTQRDNARAVAGQLYQRAQELASAAERCAWKDSAKATDATGPADLLALMYRRTDEAAGELAGYADRLRIEAQRCRASEDALTE